MGKTVCGFMIALAISSSVASIITTQFHAQDGLGSYSYGFSGGPSSKTEHRSADGVVSGAYSYIDGNGFVQSATYTADDVNGFRVHASNLPVAPNPPAPAWDSGSSPDDRPLGVPVVDTPEVAAAKAAHLAAVEHQKRLIASYLGGRNE